MLVSRVIKENRLVDSKSFNELPPLMKEAMVDVFKLIEKETGNIVFRFKTKNKPALFDSDGKPLHNINVFGGSQIKVSATAAPYSAAGNNGITLYLNAVQIIELVSGSGGDSGGFGFTAEEGYKHSGETDQPKDEGSSNDVDDF